MPERYWVITDVGRVQVEINPDAAGLDPDFIRVLEAGEEAEGAVIETPLRAFAAKMVDLVQARAGTLPGVSEALLALMIKEKAAEDLTRIERAARRFAESDGA